jgi:hypothetical protein
LTVILLGFNNGCAGRMALFAHARRVAMPSRSGWVSPSWPGWPSAAPVPRGGIMVATQKIQVGLIHAGKIVTIIAEDHSFRLIVDGQTARVVPRTTTREIHRYKAYAAHPRTGRR